MHKLLRQYPYPGKYPPYWKKGLIQKEICRIARYNCEHCGVNRNQALLCVHHIVWRNKADCRWENLVCLCNSCHAAVHNRCWQPGVEWSGETPEWIKKRGLQTADSGQGRDDRQAEIGGTVRKGPGRPSNYSKRNGGAEQTRIQTDLEGDSVQPRGRRSRSQNDNAGNPRNAVSNAFMPSD